MTIFMNNQKFLILLGAPLLLLTVIMPIALVTIHTEITNISNDVDSIEARIEALGKPTVSSEGKHFESSEYGTVAEYDNVISVETEAYAFSFARPEGVGEASVTLMDNQCGEVSANITFSDSDIEIVTEPCGRGGIAYENVDTISATTKNGLDFTVNVDNCIPTAVEFDSGSISENCRGIQYGYIDETENGFTMEFLFRTKVSPEEYTELRSQIVFMIESTVLEY